MFSIFKKSSVIIKIVSLLIVVSLMTVKFLFEPQSDEWRHISPAQLRAKSQQQVKLFVHHYRINQIGLTKALESAGITAQEFEREVEITYLFDHPEQGLYGFSIRFKTQVDHDILSNAYAYIISDILSEFQKQEVTE